MHIYNRLHLHTYWDDGLASVTIIHSYTTLCASIYTYVYLLILLSPLVSVSFMGNMLLIGITISLFMRKVPFLAY
jgi:hypothetical protein